MALPIEWVLFSVIFLEFSCGVFSNSFIIFRIFFTCWKHREVSGCEKIIAALSVSNLCYNCVTFANVFIFTIWPFLFFDNVISLTLFFFTTFAFISSAWLTASLCFYYYVKIQNFSSDLLSRLKIKINSLASWMIVVSVVLSLLCSLFNVLQILVQTKPSVSISPFSNTSQPYTSYVIFDSKLIIVFVSSFIPFFISVATTASVTWSLHLHKLRMVRNQTSPANGNVRKYEGTIKIMICLLTFYALTHVVMFLFYFNVFNPYSLGFWGFLVIISSYSPLQSVILSLSTAKLKRAWRKMFCCNAEPSDGDENREE